MPSHTSCSSQAKLLVKSVFSSTARQQLRSSSGAAAAGQRHSPGMTLSAQEIVDAEIAQHKIVVFSKQWCGFCKRAKDTLNEKVGRDNYRIYELEDENNEPLTPEGLEPSDFQNYFKQMVGTRSVPKIWWGGKFLGGGDDVVNLGRSGELERMAIADGLIGGKPKTDENVRYFKNGLKVDAEVLKGKI